MDTGAILSTDNAALARLKADFAGYFRDSVPGVPLKWCDGILTKLADGSATYRSTKQGPFAVTIPLPATDLAPWRKVPVIEASWQAAYPGAFASDVMIPPVIPPIVLPPPSTGKIKWLTTRAEAMAEAKRLNRPIFMLAGKNSCSVTQGMRDTACEIMPFPEYPDNPPIKALIEGKFIPWWADIDGAGHIEYEQYAPYGSFNMPLMAVIASNGVLIPRLNAAGLVVKYINGNTKYQVLYDWLKQYV